MRNLNIFHEIDECNKLFIRVVSYLMCMEVGLPKLNRSGFILKICCRIGKTLDGVFCNKGFSKCDASSFS